MSGKQKKNKIIWRQYIPLVFFMLIGAVGGFLMTDFIDAGADSEAPIYKRILSLVGLLVGLYAAILVQMIIHETGHLIFGLISGYKFSSFRIFSFMWVKDEDKIKFRRLSIAGTGGQCLMTPPDMTDGKIPVVLYNLGGSLANIIFGLIFLGLFFIFKDVPFLSAFLLLFSVCGFIIAVMNGVPMRMGTVDNDGYNAFALIHNREAMRSFWVQMSVNGQIAKGVRLKDMPDEWFVVPSDEAMKNSMTAVMGVFACNRMIDEGQFEEADKLMVHLLSINSGIVGLHRSLMICDRMYVEMITDNRCEILDSMLTKAQKKFMKSMKKFPSVLRTEYVYALLCERNAEKAYQIMAQFEKCAKSYPYQTDIQAERELMEIAEEKALKN